MLMRDFGFNIYRAIVEAPEKPKEEKKEEKEKPKDEKEKSKEEKEKEKPKEKEDDKVRYFFFMTFFTVSKVIHHRWVSFHFKSLSQSLVLVRVHTLTKYK